MSLPDMVGWEKYNKDVLSRKEYLPKAQSDFETTTRTFDPMYCPKTKDHKHNWNMGVEFISASACNDCGVVSHNGMYTPFLEKNMSKDYSSWNKNVPTEDGSYWFVGTVRYWTHKVPTLIEVEYNHDLDFGAYIIDPGEDGIDGWFMKANIPEPPKDYM